MSKAKLSSPSPSKYNHILETTHLLINSERKVELITRETILKFNDPVKLQEDQQSHPWLWSCFCLTKDKVDKGEPQDIGNLKAKSVYGQGHTVTGIFGT